YVHLASPSVRRRHSGHGTGACISEQSLMTLTYRGKQYAQTKSASASASNKIRLTYRGVVYAK
ncbi:MAG: DUF4278 domain-containing protein, partial [Cyanobacteria bacterium]|nr:DUF4278 domain-containing protein [Cyanobacteriota bacterium]